MVGIREGGGGGREEWCGGCEKERVAVDGGLGFGAVMSNGLLAPATGRAVREERFTRPKMTRC